MPYGRSNKSIQNAAFKMKGMNHGEGTGSAFKQTEDDKPPWYKFKKRKQWREDQENKSVETGSTNTNKPKKHSKINVSIKAMEDAYTGKTSGKQYDRDINLFKDAYGDDASKTLIANA